MNKTILGLLGGLFFLFSFTNYGQELAKQGPATIDVPVKLNGYRGTLTVGGTEYWNISVLPKVSPGQVSIKVGEGEIKFSLASDGSISNPAPAEAVTTTNCPDAKTLCLNVKTVMLDFNGYTGIYSTSAVRSTTLPRASRSESLVFIKGIVEIVDVGVGIGGSHVRLKIIKDLLRIPVKEIPDGVDKNKTLSISGFLATFFTKEYEFIPNEAMKDIPYDVGGYRGVKNQFSAKFVAWKTARLQFFDAKGSFVFVDFEAMPEQVLSLRSGGRQISIKEKGIVMAEQ